MQHEKKSLFKRLISGIKTIFLRGLFTLLPITATIVIVHFCYRLLAAWLQPIRTFFPEMVQSIPGSEFIIITLVIFGIGLVLKLFILQPIIHKIENLIARIPLIRSLYSAAKTVVDFFNVPDPSEAKRKVVLIEFPRPGYYNIAFLLGPVSHGFDGLIKQASNTKDEEYFRIFMPNSPNPTTGFFFMLPKSAITDTNITFEEAIKTVVSCGLITPTSLTQTPSPHDSDTIHSS